MLMLSFMAAARYYHCTQHKVTDDKSTVYYSRSNCHHARTRHDKSWRNMSLLLKQ